LERIHGVGKNEPGKKRTMSANPAPAMRFLCLGVGAIGTYIGGSLALSGQDVVFMDRPEVADAIRHNGLHLRFKDSERTVSTPCILTSLDEARAKGPYQLSILAVKSFDTAALLKSLAPGGDWLPPFLCLQNGVENEALVAGTFGEERVIAASVTTAVSRISTGQIMVERLRGIGVAGKQPFVAELIQIMTAAGLKAQRFPNPASMKWSKMLTNLLANATSAILDLAPAAIFAHPGLFRLELGMLKEALNVMGAQQIPVCNLPGTPVRLLVGVAKILPPGLSQPLLANSLGKGRGTKMPSFHLDLYSGRGQSEVNYLNGAVVRFGEKWGVPTPINRWLNETLMGMADGTIARDFYAHDPQKFLAAIAGSKTGG
jgi:2-dehydropantoate 2-reductase